MAEIAPVPVTEETKPVCWRAGYFPVPLGCVPPESLAGLALYLATPDGYSLYSAVERQFGPLDARRLMENKVEFVYVSVRDHQIYYKTIENCITNIISDPNIQKEKKSQIPYATSVELVNQLLATPPGKGKIKRAASIAQATVQLILKDPLAFGNLYETFNHDFYTASHMVNVCGATIAAAQKMGLLDIQILQQIGTGGLLHDIGKIFIPKEILNSSETLSAEQYETIKTHVHLGVQHLEKVMELSPEIRSIVAEHHERLDGSGYPNNLKNDQLSPLGRLAGIVDSFDAMTSVRPYRSHTYSLAEALELLEDQAPEKFDREILFAFISLIETAIQHENSTDNKNRNIKTDNRISLAQGVVPKHLHYYFRIPVTIRRMNKINNKLTLGSEESAIAHRISCMGIGILSNRPFNLDQNILISSPRFNVVSLNNLAAVVTRCYDYSNGWYTVEAQFLQPKSAEIFDKIKALGEVREIPSLTD